MILNQWAHIIDGVEYFANPDDIVTYDYRDGSGSYSGYYIKFQSSVRPGVEGRAFVHGGFPQPSEDDIRQLARDYKYALENHNAPL